MLAGRVGPVVASKHWGHVNSLLEAAADAELLANTVTWDPAADAVPPAPPPQQPAIMELRLVSELEQIVRWDSHDPKAHLQLAEAYIQLFDRLQEDSVNQMPLSQVKDAALQSQSSFDTRHEYRKWLGQWLDQAVGEHHKYLELAKQHARQGLALCPLYGEGYLYLAELCFLDGGTSDDKSALINQAVAVRPFHGKVLFHAGNEAFLDQDYVGGLKYWQRSFNSGRISQRDIIDHLAGRMGPERLDEETAFILETFQPDLRALRYMYYRYRRFAEPERLGRLRWEFAQAAEAEAEALNGEKAARQWLEAMALYFDQIHRKVECGLRALNADPNSYDVRYRLALALAEAGRHSEAEAHLSWCMLRKPKNRALEKRYLEIVRNRMETAPRLTSFKPR
jgi:hypothetical protein